MYGGVLAVGIIGALVARIRPYGMARVLFAAALALALVGGITVVARMVSPVEILALNGVFVALFVGSGWLFRYAARQQAPAEQ